MKIIAILALVFIPYLAFLACGPEIYYALYPELKPKIKLHHKPTPNHKP